MSVTIPSLNPVTDILDTDKIMVTQSSGQTYTIDGASFNKRNQAVIANSTTLTGAPLKTGNIVRAYFTADITGVNTTTGLVLNYNGSNKNVKVPKDGALVNFTAQNMGGSPTVYKYLQAYTTLELLYDGTNFVIIGNPVVISSADYTIYADGEKVSYKYDKLISVVATYKSSAGNYTSTDIKLSDTANGKAILALVSANYSNIDNTGSALFLINGFYSYGNENVLLSECIATVGKITTVKTALTATEFTSDENGYLIFRNTNINIGREVVVTFIAKR